MAGDNKQSDQPNRFGRDARYRSGRREVKTIAWREVNRERWRVFERA
jgi:hypothetical protein